MKKEIEVAETSRVPVLRRDNVLLSRVSSSMRVTGTKCLSENDGLCPFSLQELLVMINGPPHDSWESPRTIAKKRGVCRVHSPKYPTPAFQQAIDGARTAGVRGYMPIGIRARSVGRWVHLRLAARGCLRAERSV